MFRLLILTSLLCFSLMTFGSPLLADVALTAQTSATGVASMADGESVTYIKGLKMRQDSGGTSLIFDLENMQMISLDHGKKRAEVFAMGEITMEQLGISDEDIDVSLEATGDKREVLGKICEDHQMKIEVAAGEGAGMPAGMGLDVVLEGPVCLVKEAPGHEDYKAFYTAAAERGFIFSNPAAAKAQPGQQKGLTTMYKVMADAGIAYATDIEVGFEGSGMMAKMMSKLGFTTSTKITEVSTDTLEDDLFETPAGYKTKKR